MKTQIKNRIENLLGTYKKTVDAFLAEIKKWEADSVYSSDYRQDKIRAVKASMKVTDEEFNRQLRAILTEEKQAILGNTVHKPADYQQQISNSLEFIKLAGKNLEDAQAYELVQPFIGDYQTMRYFRSALSNLYGKDGLPVTCFMLGKFDVIASNLDILANDTTAFFNAGTYATNSLGFAIGSDALIGEAVQIETAIAALDAETAASFKEAKQDADNSIKDEMGVN